MASGGPEQLFNGRHADGNRQNIRRRQKMGQFVGSIFLLIIPFLRDLGKIALAACTLCWGDPHDYGDGMAFALAVVIPGIFGPLFVFLPVWILHHILGIIEKRKEKKSSSMGLHE